MKPKLEIVEKPVVEPVTDWETRGPFIPECLVLSDSLLEGEWYSRQDEKDRNRRPVEAPKEVKRDRRMMQMEMFREDHQEVFQSDMKLEGFTHKPDEKGITTVKMVLVLDIVSGRFLEVFEPLFKMNGRDLEVLVASRKTTKDLG